MSIEQSFERIAVALEKIASVEGTLLKARVVGETKVQMIGAVPQVDQVQVAPIAEAKQEVKEQKEVKEPSEDELRTAVREYMNKAGKEKAIALLVKYGANAEKPMIKDVVNKVAVMQEIEKEGAKNG